MHDWPAPAAVAGAEVRIDPATGQRAGPNCPRARSVVMAYDKMPKHDVALHGHGDPDARGDEHDARTRRRSRSTAPGCCRRSSQAVPPAGEPAGKVFAQDPPPGEPIELGGHVQVSIAKPVTWVTVPDLIGLNDDGGALGAARRRASRCARRRAPTASPPGASTRSTRSRSSWRPRARS